MRVSIARALVTEPKVLLHGRTLRRARRDHTAETERRPAGAVGEGGLHRGVRHALGVRIGLPVAAYRGDGGAARPRHRRHGHRCAAGRAMRPSAPRHTMLRPAAPSRRSSWKQSPRDRHDRPHAPATSRDARPRHGRRGAAGVCRGAALARPHRRRLAEDPGAGRDRLRLPGPVGVHRAAGRHPLLHPARPLAHLHHSDRRLGDLVGLALDHAADHGPRTAGRGAGGRRAVDPVHPVEVAGDTRCSPTPSSCR